LAVFSTVMNLVRNFNFQSMKFEVLMKMDVKIIVTLCKIVNNAKSYVSTAVELNSSDVWVIMWHGVV
jgi:hypothetical protein